MFLCKFLQHSQKPYTTSHILQQITTLHNSLKKNVHNFTKNIYNTIRQFYDILHKLFKTLQSSTEFYITLQSFTELYRTEHNQRKLYKTVQLVRMYGTLRKFTTYLRNCTKRFQIAHKSTQLFTKLQKYKPLQNFTELFIFLHSFT